MKDFVFIVPLTPKKFLTETKRNFYSNMGLTLTNYRIGKNVELMFNGRAQKKKVLIQ